MLLTASFSSRLRSPVLLCNVPDPNFLPDPGSFSLCSLVSGNKWDLHRQCGNKTPGLNQNQLLSRKERGSLRERGRHSLSLFSAAAVCQKENDPSMFLSCLFVCHIVFVCLCFFFFVGSLLKRLQNYPSACVTVVTSL